MRPIEAAGDLLFVEGLLRCGGRMTVRAVVTDPAFIAKLLAALRRSRDPPTAA